MSRKYRFRDQSKLYFISFAVVNWIDVFIRTDYKEIMVNSLKFCCEHKGLEIYAWCIMTSHVHLIIGTNQDKMESIIRDLKSYTSRKLRENIESNGQESRREWMLAMFEKAGLQNSNNTRYQFWQQHNKPIELSSNQIMDQKLDYLHNNPVEAGFVENPEDYTYSSAKDYTGSKGILNIKLIG